MGSLEEEEKLVQMIQDFIESDSSSSPEATFRTSTSSTRLSLINNHHPATYFTLQETLRSGTKVEKEIAEKVKRHLDTMRRSKREAEKSSGMKEYIVINLKMDGFDASLCHTSWITSAGFSAAGDYKYIDIKVKDKKGKTTTRLIVDTDFKSQFELARPTPTYKELTDTLPTIFVGNEEKLSKIITMLSAAAKQSFKQNGLHIPPWRTASYMHSKWLSQSGSHPHALSSKHKTKYTTHDENGRNLGHGSGLSAHFSNMRSSFCPTFAAAN